MPRRPLLVACVSSGFTPRRVPAIPAVVVMVACLFAPWRNARAQSTILETHGATLTSYPAGTSAAQGVKPLFTQRGVNLDGSLRAGSALAWAMAGNPFGGEGGGQGRLGDLNLFTGGYAPFDVDWTAPAPGGSRWVIGRTYNQLQATWSNGYQGKNWFQMSQPEIVFYDDNDNTKDAVYVVYGADRYVEFVRTGSSDNTFKGKNGVAGVVEYVSGSPDTYVWTDQHGTRTTFFGGNTSSNRADYQLWKIVDATGNNVAYVGDKTTASTAATSGYNTDKTITTAYDGAENDGRRYTYTYTTIDSVKRLTEVKAEIKTGGTWSSPTGLAEVARVTYDYYTGGSTNGPDGHLKSVKVRTSLTDSGSTLGSGIYAEKARHYRYYTTTWSNTTNGRGTTGQLKMVVGWEGCRNFDWGEDGAESPAVLDDGWSSATDDTLKPYSEAFFEYPSSGTDHRPSKGFFNGECGCSGSSSGAYEFTYADSSSYSTYIGNTSYDSSWAKRTVLTQPDGSFATQYFDEAGQPLARVVTDTIPSGSPTKFWATDVVRNSSGQVTAIHSPANITAYTHSTGAFTPSSTAGLVTYFDRTSSGELTGFREATYLKKGTGGTAEYVGYTGYTSREYAASGWPASPAVKVYRPLVSETRAYHTSGTSASTSANYDATTVAHTYWSSTTTNVQNLTPKTITTTLPIATTSKNGPNSAATTVRYLRDDETTALSMLPALSGDATKYAYTKIDANGQTTMSVTDAMTTDSYFDKDPNATWGITESGDGKNAKSLLAATYDGQGRPDTATVAAVGSTRTTKSYYSKLADGRLVTIQIPRVVVSGSPPTTTYHGPASYAVTNHAGHAVVTGTIAITSSGITTALTSWINEGSDDPIAAFDPGDVVGTLTRMAVNVYDESGHTLEESRAYFSMPGSGAGTAGTHYDATKYGYDGMGRRKRVKDASGTITLTTFDALGRTATRQIGTNDPDESGTDDMVTIDEATYDDVTTPTWQAGNSHVSKRTLYVQDSATDKRETSYAYDYRGRMLLQTSPQAPYALNKYDHLNRVIATGMYSSAPSSTADPTSTSTNRVAYNETKYDEQGRAYRTSRYKVIQSTGAFEGTSPNYTTIDSNTWYDAQGRVIKVKGEGGIQKTFYDRLGRATNRFVLAADGAETSYADMDDVTGDTVLEESQAYFDDATGLALMQVQIGRYHNDTTTNTALDSNADADAGKITEGNLSGRPSISAMWYDELGRLIDTVAYGTYGMTGSGSAVFNRSLTNDAGTTAAQPTRSSTKLRTTTIYNDDGTVLEVEAPSAAGATSGTGVKTRYIYDAAGRKTAEVRNYTGGSTATAARDTDLYTRYVYANGLMTKMWVDLDGDNTEDDPSGTVDDDQVTTYTYGTTKGASAGDSKIGTGHLLQKVTYPDSSSGTDVVTYAYNAQSQQVYMKDQAGNVLETDYDTAGRQTHRRATTVISGFDGTIKRISTAYLSRGLVDTVTQYDHATVGSGTAKDQVQYSYDDWGNLSKFEQDVDSTISGGSGRAAFDVEYAWTKRTPTNGATTVARSTMTLPDGTTLTYGYGASASIADTASRVATLAHAGTTIASYDYLGMGTLVGTTLDEPNVFSKAYASASPTAYGNLDRFNRVVTSSWTNGISGGTDFYHVDLTYDNLGNIMTAKDTIHADTSGVRRFDAAYGLDALSRLTRAEEGNWNGSSISTRRRDEQWKDGSTLKLSQTGNWLRRKLDLNGDGDFVDSSELDDSGDFNRANEWLTRDTDSNSSVNYTLTHDAVGNMTDDGMNYTYVYDVFGRLVTVKKRSTSATVAEYKYNGLGYRTGWHYDVDVDGDVDASDPWLYFQYDERWRIVAMWRGSDGFTKEQYIFHAAGARGMGGGSYIDSVILRDRDTGPLTAGTADEMGQRRYYAQNWRADVSVILPSTGCDGDTGPGVLEWIKYSAYGVPQAFSMADYNRDGSANSTDSTDFNTDHGVGSLRADVNFDGGVTIDDLLLFAGAAAEAAGRGVQSCASTANRIGYAGYQWDPVVSLNHVRHRVYAPELGRWTSRDSLEFEDGVNWYQYVHNEPTRYIDPTGLRTCDKTVDVRFNRHVLWWWDIQSTSSVEHTFERYDYPRGNPLAMERRTTIYSSSYHRLGVQSSATFIPDGFILGSGMRSYSASQKKYHVRTSEYYFNRGWVTTEQEFSGPESDIRESAYIDLQNSWLVECVGVDPGSPIFVGPFPGDLEAQTEYTLKPARISLSIQHEMEQTPVGTNCRQVSLYSRFRIKFSSILPSISVPIGPFEVTYELGGMNVSARYLIGTAIYCCKCHP